MPSFPNLLVIIADDHAKRVLGASGSANAHTPNLDALAAESAHFQQLFCTSPLCTPARASLLTGLMPPRCGVTLLNDTLEDGTQTLARQMRANGYRTACFGKMHFGQSAKAGLHGFEVCRSDLNWYGPGHHPDSPDSSIRTQPPWRPLQDPARVWLNADRLPYPAYDKDKPNRRVANEAGAFLTEDPKRPFLCWVGFNQPHCPFNIPIDARERSDPSSFTLPQPGPDDHDWIPKIFHDLSPDDQRGIIAAYHDAVAYLDDLVGSVLRALERAGHREDTIVLYTSDHGYLLGEHGRFEKHCHFDEALRVPGMLRWPGRIAPGPMNGMCSAVDLAPTLLSLCGAAPFPDCDGFDLAPNLAGTRTEWPRSAIGSVYAANREACLREARYKLVHRGGDPAQPDPFNDRGTPFAGPRTRLYDLESDPNELADRSAQNPERCRDMLKRLKNLPGMTEAGVL